MEDNTNREKQFQLTSAVIEARRSILQELPFDELCDILRNQTKEPQEVVGRASRAEKKKLIDNVIEHMVKNYNLVTEERYAFVLWLYRIRTQYKRMGLFQPDFICIIFGKMMPSKKFARNDVDI